MAGYPTRTTTVRTVLAPTRRPARSPSPRTRSVRPRWVRVTAAALLCAIVSPLALVAAPSPLVMRHPGAVIDATARLRPAGDGELDPGFGSGGRFLLTTYRSTPLRWGEYAWYSTFTPATATFTRRPAGPPPSREPQLAAMEQTKEVATAVAYCGVFLCRPRPQGLRVASVMPASPADDAGFAPGDVIVSAQVLLPRPVSSSSRAVVTPSQLRELLHIGSAEDEFAPATLVGVLRDGVPLWLELPTRRGPLGVRVVTAWVPARRFEVPTEDVGGPSAGLMMALVLTDAMTAGDLAAGRVVAGTGTIAPSGKVGPIGGVRSKVEGAIGAGAEVFLTPPVHAEGARDAARGRLLVVEAATYRHALRWLCVSGGQSSACSPPVLLLRGRLE